MSRNAPASDMIPLGDGRTVLVRDVPASGQWTATIQGADGTRVEPAEFALLPGGHVVLDVREE